MNRLADEAVDDVIEDVDLEGVGHQLDSGDTTSDNAAKPRKIIRHINVSKQRVLLGIAFIGLTFFITIIGLIILLLVSMPIIPNSPPIKVTLVQGRTGAVAADNPLCSQLGVDILKSGGNAVDSIITTCLCIGVMNPWSSGIGGGGIMVISDPQGRVNTIDFRETAPGKAHRDMFVNNPYAAQRGGLAVAVPSELKGLYTAWKMYGGKPWSSLIQPIIELAKSHDAQQLLVDHLLLFEKDILNGTYGNGMKKVYAPQGRIVRAGEKVENPMLAERLRIVAEKGADAAIYTEGSPLIDKIVNDVQSAGGILTKQDLLDYQVKIALPVSTYYRGLKVYGARPEISGGVCLSLMLNLLEPLRLDKLQRDSYQVNHYIIEAMKFAFGHRMSLGDENFLNISTIAKDMQNKDYASLVRKSLLEMGVQRDIRTYLYNASILNEGENNNPLRYAVTDHGTSHMTAVDSNRMAVALTSTVNLFFGSHVLSEQTGILYNDQMDDFSIPNATNAYSLPPTEANFIQPGKRPLSSMTPTMVHKNGKFYVTLGGSGGPFILTATMQSLLNIIDFDMDVASAIQKPRIHHQLIPPKLEVETNFPVDALSKILQYDGYEIDVMEGSQENLGVVQGIMLDDNGVLEAASDIRKKSFAAAY